MKKSLFIPLILLTLVVAAQTRLDSLIFHKINGYRTENCLDTLMWSTPVYLVAKNQAMYISLSGSVSHDQTADTLPGFRPEPDFAERFERYGICKSPYHVFGENLTAVTDTSLSQNESIECIAAAAFESWKNSPEHNELLLYPLIHYGAVSTLTGNSISEVLVNPDTGILHVFTAEKKKVYFCSFDVYR